MFDPGAAKSEDPKELHRGKVRTLLEKPTGNVLVAERHGWPSDGSPGFALDRLPPENVANGVSVHSGLLGHLAQGESCVVQDPNRVALHLVVQIDPSSVRERTSARVDGRHGGVPPDGAGVGE